MIKVFVMQTCPDCTKVKELAKGNPRLEIIDIGEHVRNLKQFLALRDNNPVFNPIREKGSVGIPCFVLEDGSIVFSMEETDIMTCDDTPATLEEETEEGSFCSIDGKGC